MIQALRFTDDTVLLVHEKKEFEEFRNCTGDILYTNYDMKVTNKRTKVMVWSTAWIKQPLFINLKSRKVDEFKEFSCLERLEQNKKGYKKWMGYKLFNSTTQKRFIEEK